MQGCLNGRTLLLIMGTLMRLLCNAFAYKLAAVVVDAQMRGIVEGLDMKQVVEPGPGLSISLVPQLMRVGSSCNSILLVTNQPAESWEI